MSARNHLLTLLEDQRAALLRLQELAHEERACLMAHAIARLDELIALQTAAMADQAHRSRSIEKALARLAAELQLDGRISLANIVEQLAGPGTDELRGLWRELTVLSENLQRESRVNWALAQQVLKYIDFTLRMVGETRQGPLPYTPQARARKSGATQLMVNVRG